MSVINPEQELCKRCGFCCDGTLFRYAVVKDDDVLLPGMEEVKEKDRSFRQPCPYFSELCTAYHLQRPSICCSYRCDLLEKASDGEILFEEVAELVRRVKSQKARLEKMLEAYSGYTLDDRYEQFEVQHKLQLNTPAFRIQHKDLLIEWALYRQRLKEFDTR